MKRIFIIVGLSIIIFILLLLAFIVWQLLSEPSFLSSVKQWNSNKKLKNSCIQNCEKNGGFKGYDKFGKEIILGNIGDCKSACIPL